MMDTQKKDYFAKAERWEGDTPGEQTALLYAVLALVQQTKRVADALEAMNKDGLKTWTRNPEAI